MLDRSFAGAADRVAIIDGPARLTYAELARRSAAVAAGFAARGVRPGDRVAVMLDNGLDAAPSVAAIARLGAVLVPRDCVRLRAPEIAYILGDAEPVTVIHGAAFAGEVAAAGAPASDCLDTSRRHGARSARAPRRRRTRHPTRMTSSPSSTRPARPAGPRARY